MSNSEFINYLLEQGARFIRLSETEPEFYVPALNCIDAAWALANYNEAEMGPMNLHEETGLTLDSDIGDIELAIFDLTQPHYQKHRTEQQILDYHKEAEDKVWYCRTQPSDNPEIEAKRLEAKARIETTYPTVDVLGSSDPVEATWQYGYWSGIMSALRWVLGEDKDQLYT